MIESTGSMGRTATYAEELFVAEIERLKQENEKLSKRLSGALQHLEEAREGRAAAIDRLTPLGCENERLREAFRRLRLGICLHATDTVWAGPAETAVDFITRHLADEWTEQSLSEPQSAPIDSVSGNEYSTPHGKDESGTTPGAARETREAGPEEI